ncbi:hypothetical protein [Vibrio splendidus]|uniref:hypothetical protein n=1 Tax=Vibrio splendidus TaxID=29497 RepID=UPI000D398882|nr:hypothetical protein [Vibrio splendidus]PTP95473.1 hypothetical protein CWO02_01120 [Vibrio splendidus]
MRLLTLALTLLTPLTLSTFSNAKEVTASKYSMCAGYASYFNPDQSLYLLGQYGKAEGIHDRRLDGYHRGRGYVSGYWLALHDTNQPRGTIKQVAKDFYMKECLTLPVQQ